MSKKYLIAVMCLGLMVAGCGRSTSEVTRAVANPNDTRMAKAVFGPMSGPASGLSPDSFGSYAKGCLAGAEQLAETGPTWQAMRLSRNRNWGNPVLIDYLERTSAKVARLPGWNGLYVGDMSQPRGGPMSSGHASHQIGLDADIWMLPPTRLNLSASERESLSSIDMQRAGGAYVNSRWTPTYTEVLKTVASDPAVARIFIFPGAKVQMCKEATGDRSWLNKIRPWYGHNYHFHVRLACPKGDADCVDQAPPPPGDGCADAQAWVNNIINPPPPKPRDPNAPKPVPTPPLTMARMPAQCGAVAAN
ncbi:Penicillin-insensitive murein endopeptidase precursor [Aquimixticola soesokkakensis]|uniref:Penicillin-insensitive murein endopeptidase n=1 Tax=Aquimixticola soesokkakensis TaxID=1519096 RepID=A0A1Y5RFJ6_9RHOB|nr:penicillin-insensitive murein endopeptidase [Aquimixticola soesokkakensis]SLN15025.1 Penicillin-insensitive murein endopeptidase precursor [Aquimixticola soesokkakensis]